MKKLILSFYIFISLCTLGQAQTIPTPAVQKLRLLIESAKTGFKDNTGDLIREDKTKKINFYKTKKETAGAQTFIYKSTTGDPAPVYVITYNLKGMEPTMMTMVMTIVDQYIDELNVMIQSGNYTGRDYKDEQGMDITEMKDKKGNHILDYGSDKETQNIYIFGLK